MFKLLQQQHQPNRTSHTVYIYCHLVGGKEDATYEAQSEIHQIMLMTHSGTLDLKCFFIASEIPFQI